MSREIWLRPNRRVQALGFVPAAVLVVGGSLAMAWSSSIPPRLMGIGALLAGGFLACLVSYAMCQPRLAYHNGHLLVYLGTRHPRRVPIDVVECFFLGQGPSMLPESSPGEDAPATQTSTVVVRLAESADAWRHAEVNAALGHWCDGYIAIRGTWCEPLGPGRLAELNGRLLRVHRELRAATADR